MLRPVFLLSEDDQLLDAIQYSLSTYPVVVFNRTSQLLAAMLNVRPVVLVMDFNFAHRVATLLGSYGADELKVVLIYRDLYNEETMRTKTFENTELLHIDELDQLERIVGTRLKEAYQQSPSSLLVDPATA